MEFQNNISFFDIFRIHISGTVIFFHLVTLYKRAIVISDHTSTAFEEITILAIPQNIS